MFKLWVACVLSERKIQKKEWARAEVYLCTIVSKREMTVPRSINSLREEKYMQKWKPRQRMSSQWRLAVGVCWQVSLVLVNWTEMNCERGQSLEQTVKYMADTAASFTDWLWVRRKMSDWGKNTVGKCRTYQLKCMVCCLLGWGRGLAGSFDGLPESGKYCLVCMAGSMLLGWRAANMLTSLVVNY